MDVSTRQQLAFRQSTGSYGDGGAPITIIAYVNYSQVLKGAADMQIARELESHAKEELDHAMKIAKQIDYLGGMPSVTPVAVKTS